MLITATKDGDSFTINNLDKLTATALAMAELNRRWGYQGSILSLSNHLKTVVSSAKYDSNYKNQDVLPLMANANIIQILEELARTFRAIEDENADFLPRFKCTYSEAEGVVRDYANSVGALIQIQH